MSSLVDFPVESGYGTPWPDWIDVVTPAAGTQASYTVPGESWVRVVAARLLITTSATVANRFVSLDFVNARNIVYVRNAAGLVVTASTTAQAFEWSRNRTVAEWAANTPVLAPVLDTWLTPGFVVRFAVDAIDTTDQISGLRLYLERWRTGRKSGSVATFDPMPPR